MKTNQQVTQLLLSQHEPLIYLGNKLQLLTFCLLHPTRLGQMSGTFTVSKSVLAITPANYPIKWHVSRNFIFWRLFYWFHSNALWLHVSQLHGNYIFWFWIKSKYISLGPPLSPSYPSLYHVLAFLYPHFSLYGV